MKWISLTFVAAVVAFCTTNTAEAGLFDRLKNRCCNPCDVCCDPCGPVCDPCGSSCCDPCGCAPAPACCDPCGGCCGQSHGVYGHAISGTPYVGGRYAASATYGHQPAPMVDYPSGNYGYGYDYRHFSAGSYNFVNLATSYR